MIAKTVCRNLGLAREREDDHENKKNVRKENCHEGKKGV
jgi:hypothetical protein